MSWLSLPFLLQGILMFWDERLHQRRGLGTWERLGHPLDTMTVFVPLSYVAMNEISPQRLTVFCILAGFSCLFITKDEFVHTKECRGLEHWIHSVLFVLHPVIFLCTGLLWKHDPENQFLSYQPLIVGFFMTYQIARWSIPWKEILK